MAKTKLDIGLNSLIEDILGLNIRGLTTIRDVVVRPNVVAEAARDNAWLNKYTPSIRLVFFLLSLTSLLRFLWAPADGVVTAQLNEAFQNRVGETASIAQAIDQYMATYGALYPFLAIGFTVMAASFLRVWGKGTTFALRVRLHLMVLIPSSACSVFAISAFGLYGNASDNRLYLLTALSLIGGFLVDCVMAYRCVGEDGMAARLGKTMAFTLTNQLFLVTAAVISAQVAMSFTVSGI